MINNRQSGRRNRGRNNNGRPNGGNRGGGDNGNRIDNRARGTIHFTRRLGAILLSLVLVSLAFALMRRGGHWYRYGHAVIGALTLQVLIGLSVVHFQLPLLLADAHNAGAAVLLLTLVALNHAVFGRRHD